MDRRSIRAVMVLVSAVLAACGGGDVTDAGKPGGDGKSPGGKVPSEEVEVELAGAVQKGPFVAGSKLSISPLDSDLDPIGDAVHTETINDLGEFEIQFAADGPVRLEAVGAYYNEITGELAPDPVTLRALYVPPGDGAQRAYVNVITHLVSDRVERLHAGSVPFDDAVVRAERELRESLGLTAPAFDPDARSIEMNLAGGDTAANAYLFGVSAVLAKVAFERDAKGPDAELRSLLDALAVDFGDDGMIADDVRAEIGEALLDLEVGSVRETFGARLAETGSSEVAPDLHRVLDQDRDEFANAEDNCPLLVNPAQVDGDDDGVGDGCDNCPDTKCPLGCVPGEGGGADTCIDACDGYDRCGGSEQCVGIQWIADGGSVRTVRLCAEACDPLASECGAGQLCERGAMAAKDGSAEWHCVPAPEGVTGAPVGADCGDWVGSCEPGLVCDDTDIGRVCTTLCDPDDAEACDGGACRAIGTAYGACGAPAGEIGERCLIAPDTCAKGLVCAQSGACADAGGICCHEACDPDATGAVCGDGNVCVDGATDAAATGACFEPAQLGEPCFHAGMCDAGLGCAYGDGCPDGAAQCCRTECDPGSPTACDASESCTDSNSYDDGVFLCVGM